MPNRTMLAGGADDPAITALIGRMTTKPTTARATLIARTITRLRAAGVWSKHDALWVMAGHHEQASRLDWKGTPAFTLTPADTNTSTPSAPSFTADRGWTGNGTTTYLDTNWDPSVHGRGFTLNAASIRAWVRTNLASPAPLFVAGRETPKTWLQVGAGIMSVAVNQLAASAITPAPATSVGLFAANRVSGAEVRAFANGALASAVSVASSSMGFGTLTIGGLRMGSGGAMTNFAAHQHAFFGVGAPLTDAEEAAFYAIMRDYMLGVGAAT